MKFHFYKQLETMDCGPTCLRMVAKYYGKNISLNSLRHLSGINKSGVSMLGISEAAENIGFRSRGAKLTIDQLTKEAKLPAILHWSQNHFVVLPPQKFNNKTIGIADPSNCIFKLDKEDFESQWLQSAVDGTQTGVALLLDPTSEFYERDNEKDSQLGWGELYTYLFAHKKYLFQIILGLGIGSLLQLILPFLTQSIVDTGIGHHDLKFIYVILIAQFILIISRTLVDFIRNRILLFISTHINISILSDFWIKMMKLPLSYFDSKQSGDTLQRIYDHKRIEQFLTGATINSLFSLFSLLLFAGILLMYNVTIFEIFSIGSILYVIWIRIFLRYRRKLDYKRFSISSKENSATMQLVFGMQEIKLNNAEKFRRWHWEGLQASLSKINFRSLSLNQYQQSGAIFLNEGKNILITFYVAKEVLEGYLTLGAMIAIQYIIGQLNSPIEQLVGFIQQAQDARISLERLNEIRQLEDEESAKKSYVHVLPDNKSIFIKDLTFTYSGAGNEPVLNNVKLDIEEGKVTAIVGMSGSGKTTLLKLLLRFYENYLGEIKVGMGSLDVNLKYIGHALWRSQCGSVMQDGYIFDDNIAANIAAGDDEIDYHRLIEACKVANIIEFVNSLPFGFNTTIGNEGKGISQGQKQRILIARAIYKNPFYLFFDEATNALDANNEKIIMDNLDQFFKGRTVVVVAHRLSTVRNADKIIVLHNGVIVEQGSHLELSEKKGKYYELVKNQLELGN